MIISPFIRFIRWTSTRFSHRLKRARSSISSTWAFFIAGPLGTIALKGRSYEDVYSQTHGGQSVITRFIPHWKIKDGVAEATDCAFATRHNRVALTGKLTLVSEQYDNVIVALLDERGWAKSRQGMNGPFGNPQMGVASAVESLAGPISIFLGRRKALSRAVNARSFITALCSNLQNDSLLVIGFVVTRTNLPQWPSLTLQGTSKGRNILTLTENPKKSATWVSPGSYDPLFFSVWGSLFSPSRGAVSWRSQQKKSQLRHEQKEFRKFSYLMHLIHMIHSRFIRNHALGICLTAKGKVTVQTTPWSYLARVFFLSVFTTVQKSSIMVIGCLMIM